MGVFDLEKNDHGVYASDGTEEQISAADYDPSHDRREDEEKRLRAVVAKDGEHHEAEVIEVEEEEEDVDDMFALDVTEKKPKKIKKVVVSDQRSWLTLILMAGLETSSSCTHRHDSRLSFRSGRILPDRLG